MHHNSESETSTRSAEPSQKQTNDVPLSAMAVQILKADIDAMHLEVKLKRLDYKYAKLLRKQAPTYEEMNILLKELQQVAKSSGLHKVDNYQALLQNIKQKVVQINQSGKLIKASNQEIKQVTGLNLAVQQMKSQAFGGEYYSEEEYFSSDQNTLQDALETLDWEYEKLLANPTKEGLQVLLQQLKHIQQTKGIKKVQNYQGYMESIKAKVLRIHQQVSATEPH